MVCMFCDPIGKSFPTIRLKVLSSFWQQENFTLQEFMKVNWEQSAGDG